MISKVILVDTSWVLHRTYYVESFRELFRTINGVNVNVGVFYSFTQLVESILLRDPNSLVVFCLDSISLFRKEIDENYKANRSSKENYDKLKEIYAPLPDLEKVLLNCDRVRFCKAEDKEADDVIAQLFFEFSERRIPVIIYSGDNDTLQLKPYGARISRKMDRKGFIFVEEDYIQKKYGVESRYLLKYRSIVGDPSDNIKPVVPRLSRSFIRDLVLKWDSLDLREALNSMKDKKNVEKVRPFIYKIEENYSIMNLCKYENQSDRFDRDYRKPVKNEQILDLYGLASFKDRCLNGFYL